MSVVLFNFIYYVPGSRDFPFLLDICKFTAFSWQVASSIRALILMPARRSFLYLCWRWCQRTWDHAELGMLELSLCIASVLEGVPVCLSPDWGCSGWDVHELVAIHSGS